MSNETIDKMAEQYKDFDSLKAYSNAQFQTILKLQKRLAQLERDNQDLKEKTVDGGNYINVPCPNGVTDEEAICIMELNRLRIMSMASPLTLEECRKVEMYVRTLATIRNQPKKLELNTKGMSAEELLSEFDKMMRNQDLVLSK